MNNSAPNKITGANSRPAFPLDARLEFERASCDPPHLSALSLSFFVRCLHAMQRFDPNAPLRMWLEKSGSKSVNPLAAAMTIVGMTLLFVSGEFGWPVLGILSCALFFVGIVFLHGFRLRKIRRDQDDDDDDQPSPGSLF